MFSPIRSLKSLKECLLMTSSFPTRANANSTMVPMCMYCLSCSWRKCREGNQSMGVSDLYLCNLIYHHLIYRKNFVGKFIKLWLAFSVSGKGILNRSIMHWVLETPVNSFPKPTEFVESELNNVFILILINSCKQFLNYITSIRPTVVNIHSKINTKLFYGFLVKAPIRTNTFILW